MSLRAAAVFRDPIEWEATLPIRPSSPAWRACIKAAYGTALDADELALFRLLSGGVEPPPAGCVDLMVTAGRRSGKSEEIARVAVFEIQHGGHEIALAAGQRGMFAVISPLREQSDEIINYAKGLCALPAVKRHVAKVLADEIQFRNGLVLRVFTCDAVAVSGPTLVGAVYEEWAKWPGDDAAVPDFEIDNSLRPALAPLEGAPPRRHFRITSAYLQEGAAYKTERANFGMSDADVLVLRGNTEQFNPAIDRAWLARERKRLGALVYAREFGGPNGPEWQPAITESWFGTALDACVDAGRTSSPCENRVRYVAAIDAAFKSDRFALAIAHGEMMSDDRVRVVVDYVHAWAAPKGGSLSADSMAGEVAAVCRRYDVYDVLADQYSFEPLRTVFQRHNLRLNERPWTGSSKPAIYRRVRDLMTDGLVRLPDHPELRREFANISGRLLRSGGETIEARVGRDDLVSATMLAASEAHDRPGHGGGRLMADAESDEVRLARAKWNREWGGSYDPYEATPQRPFEQSRRGAWQR